jgi:hypothetical protein
MSWWTSGWFLGGSRSHFPRNPIWCCPRHTEWGPELSRGPLKSSHESYVPRLPMKYSKLIVAFLGTTSQKPLFLCATRMGWYHGSSVTSQPVRFPKIRTHNPNNDGRTPSNQRRILISECEWKTTEVVFPYAPCIVYLPTFGYIWAICGVNVGKYSIHGAYGIGKHLRFGCTNQCRSVRSALSRNLKNKLQMLWLVKKTLKRKWPVFPWDFGKTSFQPWITE